MAGGTPGISSTSGNSDPWHGLTWRRAEDLRSCDRDGPRSVWMIGFAGTARRGASAQGVERARRMPRERFQWRAPRGKGTGRAVYVAVSESSRWALCAVCTKPAAALMAAADAQQRQGTSCAEVGTQTLFTLLGRVEVRQGLSNACDRQCVSTGTQCMGRSARHLSIGVSSAHGIFPALQGRAQRTRDPCIVDGSRFDVVWEDLSSLRVMNDQLGTSIGVWCPVQCKIHPRS